MGATNSTGSLTMQEVKYNPDLAGYQIIGEGDTYNIWRNRATGVEMEQYTQSSASQVEYKYFRDVFEFRYERDYIVSSLYFKEHTKQELCSTFYQGSLFLERIPLRLNEIKDLPYPDSLHLAHACLRGFRELYERVGSFSISQHLIGINSDAVVKVWISPDFGRERLTDFEGPRKSDQVGMVIEIMEIIDKSIDHRTQPESLTNFILRGGRPTFEEALRRFQEFGIRHVIETPSCLTSIAELRDRGYFKKMPPNRKTFIGQLGHSVGSSHRDSAQYQSISQGGGLLLDVDAPPLPSLNPISPLGLPPTTIGSLPVVSAPHIGSAITTTGLSTIPSHIGGIPVVQNPNIRVNTYYSNTPVGGSFPLGQKPLLSAVPRPVQTALPITPSQRPVTPSYRPVTPSYRPPVVSPKNLPNYVNKSSKIHHSPSRVAPVPVPAYTPAPSVTFPSMIPTGSIYSQNGSISQVQKIIRQIEEMKVSSIPKNETIASGYIYEPDYKSRQYTSSFLPQYTFKPSPSSFQYTPTSDGGTNPQLLKLAKQKFTKTSYDDFVTSSFPSPSYIEGSGFGRTEETKLKSILKNKMDNDFSSLKSLDNEYKTEYKSQIIAQSKPGGSEHLRTIHNRQDYPREVTYKRQVENYKASIRIYTPEELHRIRDK